MPFLFPTPLFISPTLYYFSDLKVKYRRHIERNSRILCLNVRPNHHVIVGFKYFRIQPPSPFYQWDNHEVGYLLAQPFRLAVPETQRFETFPSERTGKSGILRKKKTTNEKKNLLLFATENREIKNNTMKFLLYHT